MPNYFSDNPDLVFHFSQLDNKEAIAISENDYGYSSEYAHAPTNYEDAQENYRRVLELVGDISGNFIAERAAAIDVEGCTFDERQGELRQGNARRLGRTR